MSKLPASGDDPLRKNAVSVTGRTDAARTLVFEHGFGTDQTVWHDVAAAFADDFRIVLLDNAGAGRSAPEAFVQSRYLKLHGYAYDLLDVCDALGLRDAVLVGHSVGAMIGVLAALQRPDHFSRLVLIGASPRYLNDGAYHGGFGPDDLNELYSAIEMHHLQWAEEFARHALGAEAPQSVAQRFAAEIQSIPKERVLTTLYAILQSDHRPDVARLALPTLLLQTRDDALVPRPVAEYLHACIRGSTLRVIAAAGHLPHLTAPAAVVDAMRDFVLGRTG